MRLSGIRSDASALKFIGVNVTAMQLTARLSSAIERQVHPLARQELL
jgi:ABC-type branched-subunit amino acid transport system permease subunit